MSKNAELIERIAAHCRDVGMSETTFGFVAVNDGKLVSRLRAGRTITLATLERIEHALATPSRRGAA